MSVNLRAYLNFPGTAFDRLAEGGEVEMALQQQMWGDHYGAVIDRFAIHWMVNVGGLGG